MSAPTQPTPAVTPENLGPTTILDYPSAPLQTVFHQLNHPGQSDADYLRSAHQHLCRAVAPVYTVDELQPASVTLTKQRGSCSQRFGCLESLARARQIPTRVRALWVAGRFWAPRFRLTRPFIPRRILLAWPQFHVDGRWLGVDSLFAPLESLAGENPRPFTNDAESLFDALPHTAIDFDGRTANCAGGRCDLSPFILEDAGVFPTRDALFAQLPLFQKTLRGRAFELLFGGRKSA